MNSINGKVGRDKEKHPEKFCPTRRCLWRTGDGSYCPRHRRDTLVADDHLNVPACSQSESGVPVGEAAQRGQ